MALATRRRICRWYFRLDLRDILKNISYVFLDQQYLGLIIFRVTEIFYWGWKLCFSLHQSKQLAPSVVTLGFLNLKINNKNAFGYIIGNYSLKHLEDE